ncbi:hypothetical protein N7516_005876 [Penicillium verrucosum]|uniref:uncharacterized protein n=1 Tax=Penicillium verrucosum TaxID=60171 RepID=UPI00254552FF|nr:uncharacterized protein N7516_005876 [Penicillium verrucosum]KAJ5931387.1 hypothetical protein N7516_005876 [Penicillium verrucosum]
MARFSLSFLSIFLVLAVLTLSMPTKRDEKAASQPLGLDGPIGDLVQKGKSGQEGSPEGRGQKAEAKAYSKLAEQSSASGKPTPTPTPTNKLSSGNFVTPTATPHPQAHICT